MRDAGPSQLFTCRYWALGPACPNHDERGVNFCKFAHCDTGRLASSFDQRGTCKFWLRGNCQNGHKCFFEHRVTGVDSMYQGAISLTGMNLEIANAAARSGFNTWNHDALYELIWSVKGVALRNCRSEANRPRPKDPVYPDRFRPSGLGDNTNKKRKLPPTEPKSETPVPLSSRIRLPKAPRLSKPAARSFRYRNRKNDNAARSDLLATGVSAGNAGTFNDPIDVVSDGEDDRSKRHRLNNGDVNSRRPSANQSHLRGTAASFRPAADAISTIDFNQWETGSVRRNTSVGSFTQQSEFVSFVGNEMTRTSADAAGSQRIASQNIKELLETPLDSLSNALVMVPRKFKNIADLTQACRDHMWHAFKDNRELLSREEIFGDMTTLNAHFEAIEGELKLGIDCFNHAKDMVQRLQRGGGAETS